MVAHNEHTGDLLRSKAASETYRNNYDLIFGKKDKPTPEAQENTVDTEDENK